MFYRILENRAVLDISGEDSETFLQGIITNDIHKLTPDAPLYAAILTPQGKYLFDFILYRSGTSILMDYCSLQKEALLKKLAMYRLRSKVTLTETDLQVAAAWGEGIPPASALRDPRHPDLGYRIVGTGAQLSAFPQSGDYELHRLRLTIPEAMRDLIPEKNFPLPSNLEELNAIDYKKGCYVGQEVTARSKHRGVIRKAIYTLRSADGNLPEPGAALTLDGLNVGEVLSGDGMLCLAQIEKEAALKNQPFDASGIALTLTA